MAEVKFKPTDEQKAFLDAYVERKSGETREDVCKRAGLKPEWFQKQTRLHPEFIEYFLTRRKVDQALGRLEKLEMLGDVLNLQAQEQKKSKKAVIQPKLLETYLKATDNRNQELTITHKRETIALPEMRQKIAAFLEHESAGRFCAHCGMPVVDYEHFRAGLDPAEAAALRKSDTKVLTVKGAKKAG